MKHRWGRMSYRSVMAVGLALAFFLFMGVTFLVFQNVHDYFYSNQKLMHTAAIQLQLQRFLSALQDAETGQRGYILTGEAGYLEPYTRAQRELPVLLSRLHALTRDEPFQRQHMVQVEQLAAEKMDELEKTIQLRKSAGEASAVVMVRSGAGRNEMDLLRGVITTMEQELNLQQHQQADYTNRRIKNLKDSMMLSRILFFSLLVALYLIIYRETSRRAQAERSLQQNNDNLEQIIHQRTVELKQSNQELEQFAFVASHDLQAPLRKIQMFSELLKEELGDNLSESAQGYLNRVSQSASRMQDLIVDLLALSRINRKAVSFQVVNLHALADETVDELSEEIRKTEAQVEVGALCELEADPYQMRQLLNNLVGNALKYHQKGVTPAVKIYADRRDRNVCELVVQDNGIGIASEYQERIFEIFQRLHGAQFEGNGIGLSIVKRIVDRHGGKIRVDSVVGQGSKFIVQLPVYHAST